MEQLSTAKPVLHCQALCKRYRQGDGELTILDNIELVVKKGEMLAIVGPSGAGKTTLLHMLGGLDLPSSGRVLINDRDIAALNDRDRSRLRNAELGFVYQFHHLLAEFSAVENAAMPLLVAGRKRREAMAEAASLLERVGLGSRLSHRPAQLSGGERQRVAIARALVNRPACVLLDEPTGNLDGDTAESVHALLAELNRESATSFLIVTHDLQLAQRMDRILELRAGQLTQKV
ncbi:MULTISPECIES: lipoprotein-releasing ABC transporter ATP-binding protein LolD [Spongiibacter]|uniref:lipoprotein-releasing ABC transporter ATP-binding protein LolD n=1 Tax=Spongiibacter TaxID=630749 RepID=UPI000C0A4C90|nr:MULTISPECIES: lipoprotein-releasing ABC transporter ATP-binding protein LolD [Spongiibacter]MAK45508.1 lipoprotein-releasing system ATP-binding protein LolD [Spongiibacter sp.]MBM7422731.1 lipoprotein-releasing system ATP-binding protein [Spongiibacter marinus]MEE2653242.1 lipoprotein-releasing ABC transporter ATP-binding protein LolD [Pseudomonadota bacterium]